MISKLFFFFENFGNFTSQFRDHSFLFTYHSIFHKFCELYLLQLYDHQNALLFMHSRVSE